MPVDLTAQLTAPQGGATADPRVVRGGAGSNPFAGLNETDRSASALARSTLMSIPGPFGPLINTVFGGGDPRGRQERAQGIAQQLMARKITELQGNGLTGSQLFNALIGSEEFVQSVGELPADQIMPFVNSMVQAVSPKPLEPLKIAPGETVEMTDPETGRIVPGQGTSAKTTEEQNIAAIISAEKAGDTRRATLLKQRLLPKNESGETTVSDALKLRAAGVSGTGNPRVDKMSPEQARAALGATKEPNDTMPAAALMSRALGMSTPNYPAVNRMTPEEAEAVVEAQADLRGGEDFLQTLISSLGKQRGAAVPGLDKGRKSIQERREAIKKSKAGATGGVSAMTIEQLNARAERIASGKEGATPEQIEELAREIEAREAKRGDK